MITIKYGVSSFQPGGRTIKKEGTLQIEANWIIAADHVRIKQAIKEAEPGWNITGYSLAR